MAKAIVDPEELLRFAQYYKKFNEGMRTELTKMNGAVNNLAQTWRDQEFARFSQDFDQAIRQINAFLSQGDEHVKMLARKAQKADEYLQQR